MAFPPSGQVLVGWYEDGQLVSVDETYRFPVDAARNLQAVFMPAFGYAGGTYHSLLRTEEGDEYDGDVLIKLTKLGAFTAKIRIAGKTHAVSGKWNGDGTFNLWGWFDKESKIIEFHVDPHDPLGSVVGKYTEFELIEGSDGPMAVNPKVWTFSGQRATPPLAGAKRYTTRLMPAPDVDFALGDGFGVLNIGATGSASWVGKLGDGRAFSAAGFSGADTTIPFYTTPYRAGGRFAGRMAADGEVQPNLEGLFQWKRPSDASSTSVDMKGSEYLKTRSLVKDPTTKQFSLQIGDMLYPACLTIKTTGGWTVSPGSRVKFKMNITDGRFSGSAPDSNGKPAPFEGVILQDLSAGFGLSPVQSQPDSTLPAALFIGN